MSKRHITDIQSTVDAVYRCKSRRVFAAPIRLPADFDAAEETLRGMQNMGGQPTTFHFTKNFP